MAEGVATNDTSGNMGPQEAVPPVVETPADAPPINPVAQAATEVVTDTATGGATPETSLPPVEEGMLGPLDSAGKGIASDIVAEADSGDELDGDDEDGAGEQVDSPEEVKTKVKEASPGEDDEEGLGEEGAEIEAAPITTPSEPEKDMRSLAEMVEAGDTKAIDAKVSELALTGGLEYEMSQMDDGQREDLKDLTKGNPVSSNLVATAEENLNAAAFDDGCSPKETGTVSVNGPNQDVTTNLSSDGATVDNGHQNLNLGTGADKVDTLVALNGAANSTPTIPGTDVAQQSV